jgi:hypothetical protein
MIDIYIKIKILLACFLSDSFCQWKNEVWKKELYENYCCNGEDCMCGGISIKEMYYKWNMQHK